MFGTTTKEKSASNPPKGVSINSPERDSGSTTVIAKGSVVEGKFVSTENVRLDGTIKGEVNTDKRFVMGEGSVVEGNVIVRDAAIKGRVKGDLFVKESLLLHDTAFVEGNIRAKTITVEEGARYNGVCKVGIDTKD